MRDRLGREIFEHDTIVYVTRRGSYMDMIPAEVLEVLPESIKVQPDVRDYNGKLRRPVTLRTEEYVAILTEDQLEGRSE